MKNFKIILFILLLFTLSSCGRSEKEIEQIKQRMEDSIRNANSRNKLEDSIKNAMNEATKEAVAETTAKIKNEEANKDSIQKANSLLINLKGEYEKAKADLDVAYDGMNRIKEFKIGRPANQRENQIRNQDLYIQSLKDKMQNIVQKYIATQKYIKSLNSGSLN